MNTTNAILAELTTGPAGSLAVGNPPSAPGTQRPDSDPASRPGTIYPPRGLRGAFCGDQRPGQYRRRQLHHARRGAGRRGRPGADRHRLHDHGETPCREDADPGVGPLGHRSSRSGVFPGRSPVVSSRCSWPLRSAMWIPTWQRRTSRSGPPTCSSDSRPHPTRTAALHAVIKGSPRRWLRTSPGSGPCKQPIGPYIYASLSSR